MPSILEAALRMFALRPTPTPHVTNVVSCANTILPMSTRTRSSTLTLAGMAFVDEIDRLFIFMGAEGDSLDGGGDVELLPGHVGDLLVLHEIDARIDGRGADLVGEARELGRSARFVDLPDERDVNAAAARPLGFAEAIGDRANVSDAGRGGEGRVDVDLDASSPRVDSKR